MKDISFIYDKKQRCFDLNMLGSEIQFEETLQTGVSLSLFTDAKVDEFEIPDGKENRGFWADVLDGENTGSKLWLILRSKNKIDVPKSAEEYCKKALFWLIEDKLVDNIDCTAKIEKNNLIINIIIHHNNITSHFKYEVKP
ncbi:phage GP46 family protein [Silvanigrella aquatica]|uniref:Uncharacterized protein n=1 Tax=Silvanigrella aquatica TaxID=1915309 RepID=A0A1L4D158_9BACT|nr:phage GP46 family protein [Silvanigrella aquatica]APJ03945.1 hypothetical protein AXG55_08515 [Silvanigrella aquatica]